MAGYDINLLKGTPLYDLARNANVYGGKTLSKTEMVFFQQQCREMGFDPAKYGLEVETEDLEGANFKETQKSQKNLANAIDQAYQGQFGKKNNAVQVAKDAETRAYSIINTAKEAFTRNHGETKFAPESLGLRPNFMAPEYKGNLTKYVSDLNAWGQKVTEQYRNADAMTNEELAQLIMANDDRNAEMNVNVTNEVGEQVTETVKDEAKDVKGAVHQEGEETRSAVAQEGELTRSSVHQEGQATRSAVHKEGQATRSAVHREGEATRSAVHREGEATRNAVHQEGELTRGAIYEDGERTRDAVREEGDMTRGTVRTQAKLSEYAIERDIKREIRVEHGRTRYKTQEEAERIIDTLDPLELNRTIKKVRDMAREAGKNALEFIRENPEVTIPGLGIHIWAIRKYFE